MSRSVALHAVPRRTATDRIESLSAASRYAFDWNAEPIEMRVPMSVPDEDDVTGDRLSTWRPMTTPTT